MAERVQQGARSAEHIPANLLRLRNLFRLTDSELARLSGIKRQTLVNKLNGIGQFSVSEIGALAAIWELSVDQLYEDPADMKQWVADHEDELGRAIRNRCTSWRAFDLAIPA